MHLAEDIKLLQNNNSQIFRTYKSTYHRNSWTDDNLQSIWITVCTNFPVLCIWSSVEKMYYFPVIKRQVFVRLYSFISTYLPWAQGSKFSVEISIGDNWWSFSIRISHLQQMLQLFWEHFAVSALLSFSI